MRETVLLYNFNERERAMKVRQALLPLGFRLKAVEKKDYLRPVGTLAGLKTDGTAGTGRAGTGTVGTGRAGNGTVGTGRVGTGTGETASGSVCDGAEEVYDGPGFGDEMILMVGFTSGRVDALIKALRRGGVGKIDYKAVLTDTNKDWDSLKLYEEIRKEHEAMAGGRLE